MGMAKINNNILYMGSFPPKYIMDVNFSNFEAADACPSLGHVAHSRCNRVVSQLEILHHMVKYVHKIPI